MRLNNLFVRAAAVAALFSLAVPLRASVWLSSYFFGTNNVPTISSNDSLTSQYKLRAKINEGAIQTINTFNNNGQLLDPSTFPVAGNYTMDLYYLQYDSTGTTLLVQGPHVTQNITIDTLPATSFSVSSTSVNAGQSISLTSVTSDSDNNLTSQAIDYLPPGAGSWISGSSTNGLRWDGGPIGSNTLTNTMTLSTPGTWQFRARGGDSLGGLSNFTFINVTVAALGPAPVTTLTASGGSTVTGNTNGSTPPTLQVPSGQSFTISSLTTDGDNNLVTQQFDLSTDGGATWSLGNSGNARLWSGAATGSNTLSKTFSMGDGRYRFRAQGQDSQQQYSTYQYVDVLVATAPSITTQPASTSAVTGATVTFTVNATGTAPLSYQWLKNGAAISGATNPSYSITSAQAGDAATYSVVVSNVAGSVTSNGATLTVGSSSGDNSQIHLDIHIPTTL